MHLPFLSSNPKILKAFVKTFHTKVKPTKCAARGKKNEARKAKKEGFVTFKPKKPNVEFLLSVHAQTSQANILYMDQKAGKCTTCKRLCKKF